MGEIYQWVIVASIRWGVKGKKEVPPFSVSDSLKAGNIIWDNRRCCGHQPISLLFNPERYRELFDMFPFPNRIMHDTIKPCKHINGSGNILTGHIFHFILTNF